MSEKLAEAQVEDPTLIVPVSKRGIQSWMLFDWAAQPFHTLIITFVFAPYFAAQVASDATRGQELWGYAAGLGGLIIAFMSPILGTISDVTGPRKPWIAFFAAIGVLAVSSLWFVTPNADSQMIFFALAAFVIALVGFEFAAVFNNAMMPGLVGREELGRLSGNAWALGYAGGLICLFAMLLFMIANPDSGKTLIGMAPILGLDPSTLEGDRAAGPLSGLWFLIFIIPLFLYTPDRGKRKHVSNAVRNGLVELGTTIKLLPQNKSLFSFLLSSMFYRDALNGLYTFGGIYAVGVLGWSTIQLGLFGILAGGVGIVGCVIGGWLDNRIGTKVVVTWSILFLLIASGILISTTATEALFIPVEEGSNLPTIVFYCAGALIGAAGGALQAASRPLLVDQVEPEKMGEAFGLYALSGKATAFLAPWAIGVTTGIFDSQRIGITPVLVLFAIGLLLLLPVRSKT